MANNSKYCTFDELVSDIDPELRSICNVLREIVSSLHPNFVEIVWKNQKIASFGVGPKKMSEHYVYFSLHKKHINLGFYYGVLLSDPNNLLEGTGKQLRHVKLNTVAKAKQADIRMLIAEATTERQEYFA